MLFFKKSLQPIFFYFKIQFFQAFKKFGLYDLAKNAYIKRIKHKIRACQKLKTFTKGILKET